MPPSKKEEKEARKTLDVPSRKTLSGGGVKARSQSPRPRNTVFGGEARAARRGELEGKHLVAKLQGWDEDATECGKCKTRFGRGVFKGKRRNCRRCGGAFCDKCTKM